MRRTAGADRTKRRLMRSVGERGTDFRPPFWRSVTAAERTSNAQSVASHAATAQSCSLDRHQRESLTALRRLSEHTKSPPHNGVVTETNHVVDDHSDVPDRGSYRQRDRRWRICRGQRMGHNPAEFSHGLGDRNFTNSGDDLGRGVVSATQEGKEPATGPAGGPTNGHLVPDRSR